MRGSTVGADETGKAFPLRGYDQNMNPDSNENQYLQCLKREMKDLTGAAAHALEELYEEPVS
jgi:hypothetical protein